MMNTAIQNETMTLCHLTTGRSKTSATIRVRHWAVIASSVFVGFALAKECPLLWDKMTANYIARSMPKPLQTLAHLPPERMDHDHHGTSSRPQARKPMPLQTSIGEAPPPPPGPPPPPVQQAAGFLSKFIPDFWRSGKESSALHEKQGQQHYVPPAADTWSYGQFFDALPKKVIQKIFIMKGTNELRLKLDNRCVSVNPRGVALTVADVKQMARKHHISVQEGIPGARKWIYSDFLHALDRDWVRWVKFQGTSGRVVFKTVADTVVEVEVPNDPRLVSKIFSRDIPIAVDAAPSVLGTFVSTAFDLLSYLVLLRVVFWIAGRFMENGPLGLIRGGPRQVQVQSQRDAVPKTGVKFEDVAGVDDAKAELQELVDFLKNPAKYAALGATIPKGSLLVGPPGTGKTMLAKAVAGEAGVPFFYCSASSFVEVFAGVGASRVRSLFADAKRQAPCIIFIDELDAVGRARDGIGGGQNDEREQTINQLLTEMDGFVDNSGVIVLAATNRADILDRALLRPGRFDRQVNVDAPDVVGREAILKVHSRGRPLAETVDLQQVARRTPGFTGADLRNLLNEASIFAGRRQRTQIFPTDIDAALERLLVGPEKTNAATNANRQKLVAYHEAGHALVGAMMSNYDPIAKITIIPRGKAGGLTFFTPSEDRLDYGLYTRTYLEQKMTVAFGGRAAEELIFGTSEVTTGASSDFEEATRIATFMVVSQGFSDAIGPMVVNVGRGPNMAGIPPASEAMSKLVDAEVQKLVRKAYEEALDILRKNKDALHKIAARLIEKETMEGAEVLKILRGEELDKDEVTVAPAVNPRELQETASAAKVKPKRSWRWPFPIFVPNRPI